jgi:hypothetical protein
VQHCLVALTAPGLPSPIRAYHRDG